MTFVSVAAAHAADGSSRDTVPGQGASPTGGGGRGLRERVFRPGWPVTFVFAGFPLWWVLGISNFVGHLAALILLVELVRLGRIRVPRSFGLWLLFLVWVIAGALVLTVDAPYAVSEGSAGRYLTWAYRLGWYLAATIFLLYIGNFKDRLSSERIARSLAMFFLAIVAGGWLAILAPHLEFPSLLEIVLPHGISQVEFVQFLVHPTVVQDYASSAAEYARPSAPFAYANFWGLNFACALPFFVLTWIGPRAGWRRRVIGALILLLASVPAILSWNRGLWLAVLAMIALIAIRSALRGKVWTLVTLITGTLTAVAVILASPLGGIIESRLDNPSSNSTRTRLAALTTSSVLEGSPLVGFGSTRDSASAFYSVAGGDRPSCPDCSPPAMGTQGQFWLVLFAQGMFGLLFFFGFILLWFLRGLRARSDIATAALCVLTAHLVTTTIYDSLGIGTVVLFVGIALLWREDGTRGAASPGNEEYTMGGYLRLIRRNGVGIAAACVLGAAAGAVIQLELGNPVIARASVVIPADAAVTGQRTVTSLDTLTQLARSEKVRESVEIATRMSVGAEALTVAATPNSRILNLSFTSVDVGTALAGATAAADALLDYHAELLEEERDDLVAQLDAKYAAMLGSVSTVDTSLSALGAAANSVSADVLQRTRGALLANGADIANESGRVSALKFDAGRVISPAAARVSYDALVVKSVTGALVALLLGVAVARGLDAYRRPVRRSRDLARALDVDVIDLSQGGPPGLLLSRRLGDAGVGIVVSARDDVRTGALAADLDREVTAFRRTSGDRGPAPEPRAAVVVTGATRLGMLASSVARLRRISGRRPVVVVVARGDRGDGVVRRYRTSRHFPRGGEVRRGFVAQ